MINNVRIGGIDYPIHREHNLMDGDKILDGWIEYHPFKISLDNGLGAQRERVVLWHEMLHGILTQAGYEWQDESIIDALAYGIVQILRDNLGLIDDCNSKASTPSRDDGAGAGRGD